MRKTLILNQSVRLVLFLSSGLCNSFSVNIIGKVLQSACFGIFQFELWGQKKERTYTIKIRTPSHPGEKNWALWPKKKKTYKITIRTYPTQGKNYELCGQEKKRTYKITIRTSSTQKKNYDLCGQGRKKNLQNHKNLLNPGKKLWALRPRIKIEKNLQNHNKNLPPLPPGKKKLWALPPRKTKELTKS